VVDVLIVGQNMNLKQRTEQMIPGYRRMFEERGDVTPIDPLEFHLYHLALYWSRLVGFCRMTQSSPEGWIDGDMGACIEVGTRFANDVVDSQPRIRDRWNDYRMKVDEILYQRPVTLHDVEEASTLFDQCLASIEYNPWANKSHHATTGSSGVCDDEF